MRQITPGELHGLMPQVAAGKLYLLDVREPHEFEFCRIEGATLMPMHTVTQRVDELPREVPIVCICHHGRRSLQVALFLAGEGFDVINLTGGVHRWAQDIAPDMPTY